MLKTNTAPRFSRGGHVPPIEGMGGGGDHREWGRHIVHAVQVRRAGLVTRGDGTPVRGVGDPAFAKKSELVNLLTRWAGAARRGTQLQLGALYRARFAAVAPLDRLLKATNGRTEGGEGERGL